MNSRIGVDVGGTFTDLIYHDEETGDILVAKVPTTLAEPEEGVGAAVAAISGEHVRTAAYFLHGTTVGLNSLLTRTGATVGLLTTRGFRDVLEIRRGDSGDPYNLFWQPPEPLVPRRLRLPVTERMLFDGRVHVPLEADDVRAAADTFRAGGVTSVAVVFLHSYANPAHELAAAAALRKFGFDGHISLSHQVSGEYREYERTATTVVDAYVRERMETYLRRLEERLTAAGFSGSLLVTRSGGGAMSFEAAEARPFETIMSGPVAGVEGAAELARTLELRDVITADVGGTSFDTALITDGRPPLMFEGNIEGLPLQAPWVDVRSIGAGGGSLAHVDAGGLLRVGPQSAGADPGPACYSRGGTQPTVTDAALLLGMLGKGEFASGLRLDRTAAEQAVSPLAQALGISVDEAARRIMAIAAATMANAIREITVEQGVDPRGCTLMTFGGAGAMFATMLARELDIDDMLVPPYAGNFSAWGLLGADLVQTAAQTQIMPLDDEAIERGNRLLENLFAELDDRAKPAESTAKEIALDMRYVGQEYSLTVPVASSDGEIALAAKDVLDRFTREYGATFGHTMDEPAEILSLRATLRTPLPRRTRPLASSEADVRPTSTIMSWSFTQNDWLEFPIYDRAGLPVRLAGPAIVLEHGATTYLDAGFEARVDETGSLVVRAAEHK